MYTSACATAPTARIEIEAAAFDVIEVGWADGPDAPPVESPLVRFDPTAPAQLLLPPSLAKRFGGTGAASEEALCALAVTVLLRPDGEVRVRAQTGRITGVMDALVLDRFNHYAAAYNAHKAPQPKGASPVPPTRTEIRIPAARLKVNCHWMLVVTINSMYSWPGGGRRARHPCHSYHQLNA